MKDLIQWFEKNFSDLVKLMQETTHLHSQSNYHPYHQEGDVWTHTGMVCEQDEGCGNIDIEMAKLLHDIGKPFTRNEKNGSEKVSFFGHENLSMWMAIDILKKFKEDFPESSIDIVKVLKLIAWHSDFHYHKKDTFFLSDDILCKTLLIFSFVYYRGVFII